MPRKRYRGLNKVRRRLSDGQLRIYYYHRTTGKRINAIPGTKAFDEAYEKAQQRDTDASTFHGIISFYKASPEFTSLATKTQSDYGRYLDAIIDRFGSMPAEALSDHRVRGDFFEWRDTMAANPRTADLAWAVLRRVTSWAYDRAYIRINHALRPGRLYESNRADIVWKPAEIKTFMAKASLPLQYAMALALFTGQRQGDLLRLTWANVGANSIELRQSKRGRRVTVPLHPGLRPILDRMKKEKTAAVVLTTSTGRPWRADHFRHEWRRVTLKAGLDGLHFHDLRGTACTQLLEAGFTASEVASLMGWSEQHTQAMIEAYSAPSAQLSFAAITKLKNETRPILQNVSDALQNGGSNLSKRSG